MNRSTPPVRHERVFWHRLRDEHHVTDLTLEAYVQLHDGELTGWRLQPIIGPGVGPHYISDLNVARRAAWMWHHAADAIEHAGARPTPRLLIPAGHVPGQLTIDDHLEGASS